MASKKAPAKKAPAKKAPAKKVSGGNDDREDVDQYFMRQGKAYVRVPSGDTFGPYNLTSAAGRTAVKSEIASMFGRFGGGLTNRGK